MVTAIIKSLSMTPKSSGGTTNPGSPLGMAPTTAPHPRSFRQIRERHIQGIRKGLICPFTDGPEFRFKGDDVGRIGLVGKGHFQFPRLQQDRLRAADLADLAIEGDHRVGEAGFRECRDSQQAGKHRGGSEMVEYVHRIALIAVGGDEGPTGPDGSRC
jgi:hypothetical protein